MAVGDRKTTLVSSVTTPQDSASPPAHISLTWHRTAPPHSPDSFLSRCTADPSSWDLILHISDRPRYCSRKMSSTESSPPASALGVLATLASRKLRRPNVSATLFSR